MEKSWRGELADKLDDICGLHYPTGAGGIDRSPKQWWKSTPQWKSASVPEILVMPIPVPAELVSEENRDLIKGYFAVEIDKARENLPAFLAKQAELEQFTAENNI